MFWTDQIELLSGTGPSYRFGWDVPSGWNQGRGAYGGLVLGALARAMTLCQKDDGKRLRCLTGEIAAPVPTGKAHIEVHEFRKGNHLDVLTANLGSGQELWARATGTFGRTRAIDVASQSHLTMPKVPPIGEVPLINIGPPMGPEFAGQFFFHNIGPWPFSGTEGAEALGWIRPKVEVGVYTEASIIAMLDVWWPVFYQVCASPRPIATVSFTAEILIDPASLTISEPLLHQGQTIAIEDGYILEYRHLWTPSGRLVGINQQTLAIIK